jgi:signal transduction histidine kinase
MRYISHEIRTPLNTAFMGIKLIEESGETLKRSIKEAISSLKSIAQKVNDLAESFKENDSFVSLLESNKAVVLKLSSCCNEVESVLETASLIKGSCTVALETLNDMLTFDKIDENKLVLELEPVNPYKLVSEVMKPFQINAKDAGVSLRLQCAEADNPDVNADKFKINQVLRNLLSNALKFTPRDGEVNMVVETRSEHKSVRLSVVDSGCGISKENQSKLFGQYVQFNASALQQGKGSGLGLWISKSE